MGFAHSCCLSEGVPAFFMNTTKIEKQKKHCREEWFKNHKAKLLEAAHQQNNCPACGHPRSKSDTIVIDWSNPESWNYGCRFLIYRRWLIVVGDIGEAVYEWGQDVSMEFLSRIDFGYFYGKCQASDGGRRLTFWDATEAIESIKYYHKEYGEDNPKLGRALNELLERVDRHTQRADFEEYLRRAYDEGHVDGEILSAIKSAGDQPHPRSIGHFVGLQMAIEQLTKHEEKTKANPSNAGKV